MPYIDILAQDDVKRISRELDDRQARLSEGQAAFLITKILLITARPVSPNLGTRHENFHWFATLTGILECVKQELYRRRVAPYEDKKRKENGDVF